MFNKNLTALDWALIWSSISVISGVTHLIIGNSPWELPTFLITSVSLAITIVILVTQCIKSRIRKNQLKHLFEVYYELKPDEISYSFVKEVSPDQKDVKITLCLKANIIIGFIALNFSDNKQQPEIKKIYDWELKDEISNPYIRYLEYYWGGWNLTFEGQQQQRYKDQRIRIGIKYIANAPFDGTLKVTLSASKEAVKKTIDLPFKIQKQQEV